MDSLAITLQKNGWPAVGIHGDKTQLQRDKIINQFKTGRSRILVATDVAARGLGKKSLYYKFESNSFSVRLLHSHSLIAVLTDIQASGASDK